MPAGRPSVFKEEYCDMLVEHMAKGLSFESFAGIIDTCRATLYNWEAEFPQFLDAKKNAIEKSLLFWEKLSVDHVVNLTETEKTGNSSTTTSKSLNTGVWALNMRNRFNWRDKAVEQTDPTKAPKTITLKYNLEEDDN